MKLIFQTLSSYIFNVMIELLSKTYSIEQIYRLQLCFCHTIGGLKYGWQNQPNPSGIFMDGLWPIC